MKSLFQFEWAVDQNGYQIERIPGNDPATSTILGTVYAHDVIRPMGGPLRYYRPMDDNPGLWRQFAQCGDAAMALAFAIKFGLLDYGPRGDSPDRVDANLAAAAFVLEIAALIDE